MLLQDNKRDDFLLILLEIATQVIKIKKKIGGLKK